MRVTKPFTKWTAPGLAAADDSGGDYMEEQQSSPTFKVGARVAVWWAAEKRSFHGRIARWNSYVNEDGEDTVAVVYDDGDRDEAVAVSHVSALPVFNDGGSSTCENDDEEEKEDMMKEKDFLYYILGVVQ